MTYLRTFIAAFMFSVMFVGAAYARAMPESFADMVEPVIPAVVNISTTQKVKAGPAVMFPGLEDDPQLAPFRELFRQFGAPGQRPQRERKVSSLGSGFIISSDGYVVTNNHVVQGASDIVVTLHDDTKLQATLVGRDPKTDLALLKVKPAGKLPYVKLGNSDKMRVGDWVVAVGNPFGLGGTVTAGIVSARGRNINAGAYDDFIQTDAAINRGNSGGPLFNLDGEVIGINSAIFSPTGTNIGIGFAVPTSLAEPVITQLKDTGHITRGWLGVKIQQVNAEIAESLGLKAEKGALVLEVTRGGPAEKSGLLAGDVILRFNGLEIDAMRSLPRLVADAKVGSRADVTVWRKGEEKRLSVKLGELPEEAEAMEPASEELQDGSRAPSGEQVLGLYVKPLARSLKQQFGIADSVSGLLVTGVEEDSDAAEKGLRAGDVLLEANQRKIADVKAFEAVVDDAKKQHRAFVLLRVARGEDVVFVTIAVP
jgi:serine protease Do